MAKMTFYEGQTATNPQTGERIVYRGGKWAPAGAGGGPMPAKLPEPDQKRLTELKETADKSLYAAGQAANFMGLNEREPTGGWRTIGTPITGNLGDVAAAFDPELAQMRSITSRVAPNLRPTGSGSSSDTDTRMYISGFPNISAPKEANRETQLEWQGRANLDAARAAFLDKYASRFGTLQGGDVAFQQWWATEGEKKHGSNAMRKRFGIDPVTGIAMPRTAGAAKPPAAKYLGEEK